MWSRAPRRRLVLSREEDTLSTALAYLVLAVLPAAAFWAARVGLERLARDRPVPGPAPAVHRPLERLVGDLRRLKADQARLLAADVPGRVSRLRVLSLAYDDTLRACCRAVGLPEPQPPLSQVGRLDAEAALAQAGVTW